MSKLKSPEVNISFIEKGESAIQRGERGIVALALSEKTKMEAFTAYSVTDIPSGLSAQNAQYVKDVAQLQLENLADMLSLVDINRQMLNNIVHRINAVQAEDYAMISTYTSLMNQHMRLVKELQNTYKNIPQVLKKMRTEVITKPELLDNNEVITEDYGTTQFNNQKALLKISRDLCRALWWRRICFDL